jgi:hypothetical protein
VSVVVRWARSVAAVIGLATGVNVVTSGMAANPGSSLFLVPDLLVVALLLAAAAVPAARAVPALLVALGTATGVFATAAMSYALRGEVGWGVTAFAVITASIAVLLALRAPPVIDTRDGCRPHPRTPGIV